MEKVHFGFVILGKNPVASWAFPSFFWEQVICRRLFSRRIGVGRCFGWMVYIGFPSFDLEDFICIYYL